MRFRIAPDWLMKLDNEKLLNTKQVLDIYGYSIDTSSLHILVKKGHLPKSNRPVQQGGRTLHFWSVGYIKNYLKLPTEIIDL